MQQAHVMMLPKHQPCNELTQDNHEEGDILREHSGPVQNSGAHP